MSLPATVQTWSPQGHRLVALVAANHLSAAARDGVRSLLAEATLADVAIWADQYRDANSQTGLWHYVDLPLDAKGYDRDRDCPVQPHVVAGGRNDRWRDCAIDRILYNRQRLGDTSLDRADRTIALKFLVHLIGDLHQPFHAIGVQRGGNDTPVSIFGSGTCFYDDGTPHPCNLHGAWDTALIAHRDLSDQRYLDELERLIKQHGWGADAAGAPETWAMESHAIARSVLSAESPVIDEAYYRRHISEVDDRLARGGLRLASVLNDAFRTASR